MAGIVPGGVKKNDCIVSSVADDFATKLCLNDAPVNDFVVGYENPVAWHRKFNVPGEQLTKDVLFDNEDMKNITLEQYDSDRPEYIKWKLFSYNIVICYEYISKGKLDKALETINDIENILLSIEANDSFLKSIRIALNHITFSMKGHLLTLCGLDTTSLEHFIMPNNMNNVNKSGLYGIQTVFFYEYGLPFAHISKDSALKAISLNDTEAEWYFLMSKVLTNWQRTCGNFFECSEQEIHASEVAVNLGNRNHHKLHLAHIYHRMSRNMEKNVKVRNQILDAGLKLVTEVMDNTNDLFLLKNCLLSLSKLALGKRYDDENMNTILDKLISKLEKSDNGYVHGAIGNYYLFNKRNYEKANFHLKKAFDAKSFGFSIDYIYTLYKMNEKTAPVEQMVADMLKTFTHPVLREKLISQIISYLILTKDDLIGALKYIPMLLSIKNVTCVYSLQTHRIKFARFSKSFNLLNMLSEKLGEALNKTTLSADHMKRVKEAAQMLESYQLYVSKLMKDKQHIFGTDIKKDKKEFKIKNDRQYNKNNERKELWNYKNAKSDKTFVKNTNEENWRTLKPDPIPNPQVFSRGHQKQASDSDIEVKSNFNSK